VCSRRSRKYQGPRLRDRGHGSNPRSNVSVLYDGTSVAARRRYVAEARDRTRKVSRDRRRRTAGAAGGGQGRTRPGSASRSSRTSSRRDGNPGTERAGSAAVGAAAVTSQTAKFLAASRPAPDVAVVQRRPESCRFRAKSIIMCWRAARRRDGRSPRLEVGEGGQGCRELPDSSAVSALRSSRRART